MIRAKFLDAQEYDRSAPDLGDTLVADGTPHTVSSVDGENPADWRVAVYEVTITEGRFDSADYAVRGSSSSPCR